METFTITVNELDLPPAIAPIDDVFGGGSGDRRHANDRRPDGDSYSLTWDGGPPNAVINGIYILTPTADHGDSLFTITLTATQDDDPTLATSVEFRIYVAALPAVQKDEPQVNPTVAPSGGQILVSGGGFLPGSHVGIYLFSEPALVGTSEAGDDGTFSQSVGLPEGTSVGPHSIVVLGVAPNGELRTMVGEIKIVDSDVPDGDGDGLSDGEETLTGTNPSNPDSDGDGLIEGIDAGWLQDALATTPLDAFRPGITKFITRLRLGISEIAVRLGQRSAARDTVDLLTTRVDGGG